MTTRLIPAGYRVLVEPDPIEEETSGGIILVKDTVDADRFSTVTGTLVAIGEQAWTGFGDGSHWAKIGDRVQYAKYANTRLIDPDDSTKEYLLLNDNDILCTVKPRGDFE
jgi:co-chaperonin GroES (HSP10)